MAIAIDGIGCAISGFGGGCVNVRMSTGKTIVFELPARLEEGRTGPRFLGDFVRTEGKTRRFVYVATGRGAGQHSAEWSRRAKVDLPDPTAAMVKAAAGGGLVLEGSYAGTDAKGWPTCATVKVDWKVGKK